MKKISYTQHFLNRSKLRKLSKTKVKEVILKPDLILFDTLNLTKIALRKEDKKYLAVVYKKNEDSSILIITAHYIKNNKIENRIKSGRWKVLEE